MEMAARYYSTGKALKERAGHSGSSIEYRGRNYGIVETFRGKGGK
jgi:hypothetical protein